MSTNKPPIDLLAIEPDPQLRQLLVDWMCDLTRGAFDSSDTKLDFKKFRQAVVEAGYDWETFSPYVIALIQAHNEIVRIIRNATRFAPLDTPTPSTAEFFFHYHIKKKD